jgi:hypothetical protein
VSGAANRPPEQNRGVTGAKQAASESGRRLGPLLGAWHSRTAGGLLLLSDQDKGI